MTNKADTALMAIPTPGKGERDLWVTIGAAYKAAGGTFEVWDDWSRRAGDSYSQQASKDTWNSLNAAGGITERTLYGEAIKHGWQDPERERRAAVNRARQTATPPPSMARPQTVTPPPTPPQMAGPTAVALATPPFVPTVEQMTAPPPQGQWQPMKPARRMTTARQDIEEALASERQTGAARAYFRGRGFTDATIDRFQIGYNAAFQLAGTNEPRAIIPYPGELYYTARRLSAAGDADGMKYLYPPKGKAGEKRAFNAPALTCGAEIVYITEGQLDAMTVEQEGGAGIGCNEPKQMLAALAKAGNALTAKAFVIIPDKDENQAGERKADKMLDALKKEGKAAYIRELPDGVHDCNDSLKQPGLLHSWIAETPQFIAGEKAREDAERRKEFDELTGGGRLAAFVQEINDSAFAKAIPTGFPMLDYKLDGGLWPGLYIIGAISSLGKTTFALQMIDQVARDAGRGCLVFTLEMAAHELMAKSISRITDGLTSQTSEKKTMRGITAGARYQHYSQSERDLIKAAFDEYAKFAGNVCIVEGQGDLGAEQMRETVAKYTAAHGGQAPVVLVDYLQILAPADPRATDKQNADRAVTELKRIARDYKTPVIAISSFNRDNYSVGASMAAFKESGAIEYSSDVLLALQLEGVGKKEFNVDEAKKAIPRLVELVVLKNRNGQTGAKIPFEFDARFNVFRERGVEVADLPQTVKRVREL